MGEAYIVGGVRTPIGRYGGALSSARPDDLAAHVIREALSRVASVPTEAIDEVVLGCANQAGEDNRNVARMAALLAGLPETVAGTTINRLCGSGLDAVGYAARAIRLGEAEIIVAGGVESMSRAPFVMPKAESPFQRGTEIHDTTIGWRFVNPVMKDRYGIDSMPETAENVAAEFSISREDQDGFALRSQARAATAQSPTKSSPMRSRHARARRHGLSKTNTRAKRPSRSLPACRRHSAPMARSPPAMPPASTTAQPRSSLPRAERSNAMASNRSPGSTGWRRQGLHRASWASARCIRPASSWSV